VGKEQGEVKGEAKDQLPQNKHVGFWSPPWAVTLTIVIYYLAQFLAGLTIGLYPLLRRFDDAQTEAWAKTYGVQFVMIIIFGLSVFLMVRWLLKRRRLEFRAIGLKSPKFRDVWQAVLGFGGYILIFIMVALTIVAVSGIAEMSNLIKGTWSFVGCLKARKVFKE